MYSQGFPPCNAFSMLYLLVVGKPEANPRHPIFSVVRLSTLHIPPDYRKLTHHVSDKT